MNGKFDILLRGGRVIDPANGIDGVMDVAIKDGKIAAVGSVQGEAGKVLDVSGCIVTPGLVDMHCHCYPFFPPCGGQPAHDPPGCAYVPAGRNYRRRRRHLRLA